MIREREDKRMIQLERIHGLEKELSLVNEHMERLLLSKNKGMQEVMNWILDSKGKQIRPILTLLCARFGDRQIDVTEYAAIIEICHMASLVHDDVIDEASYRRGRLSVQKKFGQKMAVYAGDYMIFSIIGHTNCRLSNRHKKIYQMLEQLCEGELGQNSNLYNLDITLEKYLENIEGKTAILFELACSVGAMEGKCTQKMIKHMEQYGRNLGMMFQIRDDLIDFSSSLQKEGKPVCQDFSNGIYTMPIILACREKEYYMELKKLAQGDRERKITKEEVNKRVLEILIKSKVLEQCKEQIQSYYRKAKEALDILKDCDEKVLLYNLIGEIRDSCSSISFE